MLASLKIISVFLTAVLVIGCVATYKAAEDGVAGYRDLRVNKNTYYVEYTEAARVSWDQLHAFVLKRCAEIAKENGYDVFDVLDKDEKEVFLKSDVSEITIPNKGVMSGEVTQSFPAGARVEGRRVTYKIQLIKE